ncbi:hypothetical protein [Paenibacillus odorifer]|uniref:hypothetical protein n=1 Tax=Paenibacillus odorifer TaxID=189426 RepID=UPI00096F35BE|nr:hypothetical protein [Paenibacillus odorifer]OMD09837.1 hypothetical protein BJP50_29330 [Paenibacillus odorifer]
MNEASLKYIHGKRLHFSFTATMSIYFLALVSIVFIFDTFRFKMNTLYYSLGVIVIAYLITKIADKLYDKKLYSQRKKYIIDYFPILGKVTEHQKELILLDLNYIFDGLDGIREHARKQNEPLTSVNDIAVILSKVDNNIKLNKEEIEGLNRMYSKENYSLSALL